MAIYGTAKYGQSVYGSQAEHPYVNVSGKVMWLLQVDWDGDGDFGSEIEPQTFVKVKIRRGRKNRISTSGKGQEHPEQETLWIELIDNAARYDTFNESSPLYDYLGTSGVAMRLLMISTTSKAAAEPVFVGVLASVTYNALKQRATLIGEGLARKLQIDEAEYVYSPCQSPLPGYYDTYFVPDGSTPFPINWWRGRPGGLYLRECVALTLGRAEWPWDAYYGAVTYNDDYPDYFFLKGDSAWDSIKSLADAFAAKLFFLRDGRLFVMDRQDVVGMGSASPLAGPLEKFGLERPSPYETLRNYIDVAFRNHAVTPFKSPYLQSYYKVGWSNAGPIAIPPNSTIALGTEVYLDVEYSYDGKPLSGSFITTNGSVYATPQYSAYSAADRTGTDLGPTGTSDAGVVVVYDPPSGAILPYGDNQLRTRIEFENYHATATAYFFDVQVLVIGILETGQEGIVTAQNAASIALNKKHSMRISEPWIQNEAMAAAVGNAYLAALSQRAHVANSTLGYVVSADALYAAITGYDLGSLVDFGAKGGVTALANFGVWGVQLLAGLEMEWLSADGQDAVLKCTYEKCPIVQVLLDGSVSTGTGSPSASVVWSHTVGSGENRLLVVEVGLRAFQSVSGVAYGAQALTKLSHVQYASGNYARAEIWYLVAPAVGTANVTVTITGSEYVEAAALNFVNVHQSTPLGTFASSTGLGGSPASVNVSGSEGDLVIDVLVKDGGTLTPDAAQTSRWAASADGNWKGGGSSKLGDSTVPMSWVLTGTNAWVLGGVAVKSVTG